jgi:hypothetical protein
VVGVKRDAKKLIAAAERLDATLTAAKATADRLQDEAKTAALRSDEIAQLDADELVGDVTPDVAARKRAEIKTAIDTKQTEAARARALLVPLERRVAEAGAAAADAIIAEVRPDFDRAVEEEELAAAAHRTALRRVEAADVRLAAAVEEAEQIIRRFDKAAAAVHNETQRKREEMITWAIRNGTADAMEMLPAELRPEVERRRAELVAEQDERREQTRAARARDEGEVLPGESYPSVRVF